MYAINRIIFSLEIKTVFAAGVHNEDNVATLKGLEGIFANIVAVVFSIASIVLFFMLIFGGFKFITAGGNPEAIASAKNTIFYSIGGIILIALSFLFLLFIQDFTGANITNFSVYLNFP